MNLIKRFQRWCALNGEGAESTTQLQGSKRILAPEESKADALKKKGVDAVAQGDWAIAQEMFESALDVNPNDVESLVNLAFVKSERNDFEHYLALLNAALMLDANNIDALYMKSVELIRMNELTIAKDALADLIRTHPNFDLAYTQLSIVYFRLGELLNAKSILNAGLVINPSYVYHYFFLGNIHAEASEYTEAQRCYSQVLDADGEHADTMWNMARVLGKLHDYGAASGWYERLVNVQPDNVVAIGEWVSILFQSNSRERAFDLIKEMKQGKVADFNFYMLMGRTLNAAGEYPEAIEFFTHAVKLNPTAVDARLELGIATHNSGDVFSAVAVFREAQYLAPPDPRLASNIGSSHLVSGNLSNAIENYRKSIDLRPDYIDAYHNLLFALSCDFDEAEGGRTGEYAQVANQLNSVISNGIMPFTSWKQTTTIRSGRPLRLGLVSGDLRNHPVGFFLQDVLERIDQKKIELIIYSNSESVDNLTLHFKATVKEWNNIKSVNDEELAKKIYLDKIDILMDLGGHTALNRLSVFPWRAAPIQASWLGFWASTGLDCIDYFLCDDGFKRRLPQQYFSERLISLGPIRYCLSEPDNASTRLTSSLPALLNGFVTFGSFQTLGKISIATLDVWGRVLNSVPNSRLRLQNRQFAHPSARKFIQDHLQIRGIELTRVDIFGGEGRSKYLESYSKIDIVIDTFPFPGGTTTIEALWAGVPTVTMSGATLLQKQGETIMQCAGLDSWVARNDDEFVTKAICHSLDLAALARLRSELRERVLKSPLFDTDAFVANFELALFAMIEERFEPGTAK
jgi:protein O-GlcNAc transferase